MRNTAKFVVAFMSVPAAAALIANAPVAAAADTMNSVGGCVSNEIPAGAVRSAATAGAVRSACSPDIAPTQGLAATPGSLPFTMAGPHR
jgi:hypothetical protein